jgi:hypothetical protein
MPSASILELVLPLSLFDLLEKLGAVKHVKCIHELVVY